MHQKSLEHVLSETVNTECLVSTHAILKERLRVPRIYLLNPVSFNNEQLKFCLYTHISEIPKNTWKSVSHFGIFPYMFYTLTPVQKNDLIDMIEHQLNNVLGPGFIHYEMARFTPFSNESCTSYIRTFIDPIDGFLIESLSKRMHSAEKYIDKFQDLYRQVNSSPLIIDTYSLVLLDKINEEWQRCWSESASYFPPEKSIINGVIQ